MPRVTRLFFSVLCLWATGAAAEREEPLRVASDYLASRDYAAAITVLERDIRAHTVTTLDLLCRAYRGRIRQLIESKNYREARRLAHQLHGYEERLRRASVQEVAAIGNSIGPAGSRETDSDRRTVARRATGPAERPVQSRTGGSRTAPASGWRPVGGSRRPQTRPASVAQRPTGANRGKSAPVAASSEAHRAGELRARADAAFSAGDYRRALQAYEAAYRANPNALDETAVRRWSYCRLKEAVELINRGPRNDVEWTLVQQEIEEVVRLLEAHTRKRDDPLLRYAHFLLRVARTRQTPERKHPDMIRAAEPEAQDKGARRTRSRYPGTQSRLVPRGRLKLFSGARIGAAAPASISVTPFRIRCADPELVAYLRRELPRVREQVAVKLFGAGPRPPWPAQCVLDVRSEALHRPELPSTPPAITTVERQNGRIRFCRIELYRWTPGCADTILAHEIAHVWLAAASPALPLPPWADEGIAVLVEPRAQYRRHLERLLHAPPVSLAMLENPASTDVAVFYAAAASFADYIRSEFGMAELLKIAKRSASVGIRVAVRERLGVDSIEPAWKTHVAGQLSEIALPSPLASSERLQMQARTGGDTSRKTGTGRTPSRGWRKARVREYHQS